MKRIVRHQNVTHFLLCDTWHITFYIADWPDSAMHKRNSSCRICKTSLTPSSPWSKHTEYEHLIWTKYHARIWQFVNWKFSTGLNRFSSIRNTAFHSYLVSKAPDCWSANKHTFGSQGYGLQHIIARADPSVHVDLDPALHCVHYLRQTIYLCDM